MFGVAVFSVTKLQASLSLSLFFFFLLEEDTIITEMKMIHFQSETMGF